MSLSATLGPPNGTYALPVEKYCTAVDTSLGSASQCGCGIAGVALNAVMGQQFQHDRHRLRERLMQELDSIVGLADREGGSDQWAFEQTIYATIAALPQLGAPPTICEIGL